jgi:cytochrome c oxidase cbb3-type subunit 3
VVKQFDWLIVTLVAGNIIGALWLLWNTGRVRPTGASDNTTGHRWDEDLAEFNNPLPRWWLWMFVMSVGFGIVYLIMYPGLGSYPGTLHWTERGEHAADVKRAEAAEAPLFKRYADLDFANLSRTPDAMSMAHNIFVNTCAGCHGSDARGAPGFPNLTDNDWLYGNDEATLVQTIGEGRIAVMPPWKDVVGADGVNHLTAYVLSLSGQTGDAAAVADGAQKFQTYCVACHGADAKGMQALGAPNLSDDIWLYGGSTDAIRSSIANGRQAQMPAHATLLGPDRVRLLAAYVRSVADKSSSGGARDENDTEHSNERSDNPEQQH